MSLGGELRNWTASSANTSEFYLKWSKNNSTGCDFPSFESFKKYKWEETRALSSKRWLWVQAHIQIAVYCSLQKALRNCAGSEEYYVLSFELIDTGAAPNTFIKNKCKYKCKIKKKNLDLTLISYHGNWPLIQLHFSQ